MRSSAIQGAAVALTVVLLMLGIACSQPDAGHQPEQVITSSNIATTQSIDMTPIPSEETAMPPPTVTSTATATPVPTREPTATHTAVPTATPEAEPTETAIPSPTTTPTPAGPAVNIGGTRFQAEIADTPALRSKGLGERDSMSDQSGMLFVFESGQASSFWMMGMRFPLDFIWIGEDCTVVDLTEDVQHSPPETPSSELEIFQSASPAAYTFEINAGEVNRFGIEVGDDVMFHDIESEFAACCESGVCDGK